ncbi:MAG: methionine--tRNA ligase [Acidobacteriota bacterium]
MSTFYVTTPIYYVNSLPHIGHIYSTLLADTLARWHRMGGERTYFLTGTDEHGQKIERAAAAEGIAPIALADRVVARYHELWRELGVSHDDFIRTTEPRHRAGVEKIVASIAASGDFYLARHEGWYCVACEMFYTEKELLQPGNLCPIHETPCEWRSEDNIYFRLSKYQDRLLEWYDQDPSPIQPRSRRNEVRAFVASGLRDLSVSRAGLEWGLPFPDHPGQAIYVWLDALTNYISALGYGADDDELYQNLWQEGDTRLHLIGKDILRHHAVYWPAFLMSAGLPLPTTVYAHGWWQRDGRKMSKSIGNVVRPDDLVARFGVDSLRYYVLREMVLGQDASFSDEAFIDRYNSDLANDLGNTVSRLVTLSRRAFDGRTPPEPESMPLQANAERAIAEFVEAMDGMRFQKALDALWRLLSETSQYLVSNEPWRLLKDETAKPQVATILYNALEAVRLVSAALTPILPEKSQEVLRAIGAESVTDRSGLSWGGLPVSVELPKTAPMFPRIDKDAYLTEEKNVESQDTNETAKDEAPAVEARREPTPLDERIGIDHFAGVELRVATVEAAEKVKKSSKLLKLTVDIGEVESRTVIAGIAKAYAPDELVGRQVIVVANLAPAKLMGIESNGMVLAAEADGKPVVLQPSVPVPNGTRVK